MAMLELSCNLYSGGRLVVTDLKVWVNTGKDKEHGGFFHVSSNLEFLSGAKYRLEWLGEKENLPGMPSSHWMDVVITGVSGHIAHFTPAILSGDPIRR
jgi:hypothetical protein